MLCVELADALLNSSPRQDPEVIHAALFGLTDYLASTLLAREEEATRQVRHAFGAGAEQAILTTLNGAVPVDQRGLVNGFQSHALDIDDAHAEVRGHPSGPVLSALLAAAPQDTSLSHFLSAYIVGTEVMARLGLLLNGHAYNRGWHTTPLYGGIGATAALCHLLLLDASRTAQAMGIAATQAGGLRAEFGSPVKPLHVGFAARNAITAIQAVKAGLRGQEEWMMGSNGFAKALGYAGTEEHARHLLLENWGKPWRIQKPGLWFKRYPFCSAAMEGCDAALTLRSHRSCRLEEIEEVEIGFLPGKDAALCYSAPATGEEGRFSAEYIVCLALIGGSLNLENFSPLPIPEDLRTALKRFHRVQLNDPAAVRKYTQVTVHYRDGRKDSVSISDPKGSPGNPLTWSELLEKLQQSLLPFGGPAVEDFERALIAARAEDSLSPVMDFLNILRIG